MVKIEINEYLVNVPQGWYEIKLSDYERYYKDKPETPRGQVDYIAKILKVEPVILLEWPAEIFTLITGTLGFLFKDNPVQPSPAILINGVRYVVPIEDKISLGAWVDAEEIQKGADSVLSNLLAIVCRPVGEKYDHTKNEERAAMFGALPVSEVLGVLGFFLKCESELDKLTKVFTSLRQLIDLLPRSIKPSLKHGGGTKLLRIWQAVIYYVLMQLLNYRFRKLSRFYNTNAIKG